VESGLHINLGAGSAYGSEQTVKDLAEQAWTETHREQFPGSRQTYAWTQPARILIDLGHDLICTDPNHLAQQPFLPHLHRLS